MISFSLLKRKILKDYLKQEKDQWCEFRVSVPVDQRGKNKKHGDKCRCQAAFLIDKKKYCVRHAQSIALEILIKERGLKIL